MTSPIKTVVVDPDNHPLAGARVSAGDSSAVTDEKGRAALSATAGVELRVEADGYEGQSRTLRPEDEGRAQRFVLGRPDMPYYYRGRVKVPFEPLPGVVGVLTRPEEARGTRRAQLPEGIAVAMAERVAAQPLRQGGNFARSGITVLQLPEEGEDAVAMATPVSALAEDPAVEAVGAVVRLSEDHASFLTDLVIARFEDGVDEARVAELAERHGLAPAGRFDALGNVHRLRFTGPPTYALLAAANALAEEPEVVYAEPNLAHTTEEDAVVPTDFLFPEQWDHRLINTPDAWQALRDLDPARTFGDADLVVAVVDSGVDLTHPEFSGTVSSGAAKQVSLFNFALMQNNMNSLAGDHGTCCASAAVANVNNPSVVAGVNEGVAGVAGNCRLIAIRRGGDEARYAEMYLWAGGFDPASTTAGFPAQLARGADIITNSFGSSVGIPISGLMSDTFDRLTNDGRGGRGVLLFFSAGNINQDLDDTDHRPWGMYDRCFCVSASTLADDGVTEVKADYSSFGSTVDWCAPSSDNDGRHNPPGVFGAHTATIVAAPEGDAICGHPAQQTTLAAAAAAGATVLTLTSAAGFAANQAILAGAPGGGAASGRLISAVNMGANQITLDAGLGDALPAGAPVVAGPRAYCTSFGGTSHATPLSAGIGALILSANPQLRWDEVRDLLRATAVKIDPDNTDPVGRWRDLNGLTTADPGYLGPSTSEWYGFGRLDAAAAVRAATARVTLMTPGIDFNDVPEGETTVRPVRFAVQSRWPLDLDVVAGPGAPFAALAPTVSPPGTPFSDAVEEVILWMRYTGSAAGDTASGSVTVRLRQTGRQWVVPITASTVERQSACMMLCLDRSGSMEMASGVGTAKRIDVLRFSAGIMIDVVHEGDGVGIVAFDHDAHDVEPTPLGPLGPASAFDLQRDQLRAKIDAFDYNPNGFTAIGDGVERAQLRLDPVGDYDTKSVVVFTDGYETDDKYIADVAGSITDRVFAVGLGRAENIQPTALTALTNGTGGYVVLTGDLGIDSRYKLAKYFLQVLAGVKNEDVVVDPDGWLGPEQVHEIPFDLAETDIATDVILMTPGPGLIDMELVTPNGAVIDPATALGMPGGLYFGGRNVSYYRLALPAPVGGGSHAGQWQARIGLNRKASGDDALKQGFKRGDRLPYSMLVHTRSNLRMATTLAQSGFAPGTPFQLRAVLTEYGMPVEGRASMRVRVTDPSGLETMATLAEEGPGVFQCTIPSGLAGTYEMRVMARGHTLGGEEFTREAVRTGAVWIGGERPAPSTGGGASAGDLCNRMMRCLWSDRVARPRLKRTLLMAAWLFAALIVLLIGLLMLLVVRT